MTLLFRTSVFVACASLTLAAPYAFGQAGSQKPEARAQAKPKKPAKPRPKPDSASTGTVAPAKPAKTADKPKRKPTASPSAPALVRSPAAPAKDGKPRPLAFKPEKAHATRKPVSSKPVGTGARRQAVPNAAKVATVGSAAALISAPDDDRERPSSLSYAPVAPATKGDIDTVRDAVALARKGSVSAATERKEQIRDPAGQKLVEWTILRSDGSASFARYAAFLKSGQAWPSAGLIRRRAEGQLWSDAREPGAVFAFFSDREPISGKGRFALARALLAQGDKAAAQRHVREAWRVEALSADQESQAMESFGALLTRADHKARMDVRLYDSDHEGALRVAKRLGDADLAIAQARIAVNRKAGNAGTLLNAVPAGARGDAGYMFSRIQWLRRQDKDSEAAQLMLSAPRDPAVIHDVDEWWIERRLIARRMLDDNNPRAAYKIASDAARPGKENLAVEQAFTAGWIALRFLRDPATAARHFGEIARVTEHPTSLARSRYWLGRSAEAAGRNGEAREHYQAAARHSAAYYGQLARARLGQRDITARRPPTLSDGQRASLRNYDIVRAFELLYATGNRDLVVTFVADLERVSDAGVLTILAETAAKHDDARAMLAIGKTAIAQGYEFDHYAFPNALPKYAALGSAADRSTVHAIARQESAFHVTAISKARAMGLMQVLPSTGRIVAKKLGIAFSEKKLLGDPTFNMQVGSAEIGNLVRDFDGNYAMAFAAYNAGRGRVKEWIEKYGDPRSSDVDPIDWVERIPFTETRNYVQRVMENMHVYRARFGNGAALTIEADMRGTRQ